MSEVLRVNSLGRSFGATPVLSGVSFALGAGERLAVLGSSGSGKTTLLRLIAGLEEPTTGEISIAGQPASGPGQVVIAPEHRGVALVFQGLALFPHLRALDQVAFAAKGKGGGGKELARELLQRVGLGGRAEARLDELSGGERQRIALARALAQRPRLILMDEPFASLDDEKRGEMRDLLRSLLEPTQAALILVTHSRDDALNLAQRVIVLDRGRPVASDLLEAVLTHPGHAAAARALGLGQVVEARMGGAPPSPNTGPASPTPAAREISAQTAFGPVRIAAPACPAVAGRVWVLLRPHQPQLASNGEGVEARVVSVELRPPESGEIRRIAVVRVGEQFLRVMVRDRSVAPGASVRVRIEGVCECVEGEPR